jgi:N-acetylmuramoyl-L-alanine amidase
MTYSHGKRLATILSVALLSGFVLLLVPGTAQASRGYSGALSPEVSLLARLIYAEAAGESYQGKVAVGAVVMNRMRTPGFPETIQGIIYEPWQFSSVGNFMFNMTPDYDCVRAAREAMNGADPTGGALYYFNWHIVTNSWLWSRPYAAVIGNHYFTF